MLITSRGRKIPYHQLSMFRATAGNWKRSCNIVQCLVIIAYDDFKSRPLQALAIVDWIIVYHFIYQA